MYMSNDNQSPTTFYIRTKLYAKLVSNFRSRSFTNVTSNVTSSGTVAIIIENISNAATVSIAKKNKHKI